MVDQARDSKPEGLQEPLPGVKPPDTEEAKHFPPLRLAASPPIGAGEGFGWGAFIRWLAHTGIGFADPSGLRKDDL